MEETRCGARRGHSGMQVERSGEKEKRATLSQSGAGLVPAIGLREKRTRLDPEKRAISECAASPFFCSFLMPKNNSNYLSNGRKTESCEVETAAFSISLPSHPSHFHFLSLSLASRPIPSFQISQKTPKRLF